MSTTIESLVGVVKYDTTGAIKALVAARTESAKLRGATKLLEDEQRKSGKTTQQLREDLQDLRVALHKGLITKQDFRKRTAEVRLAMNDEANAARRAASGIRELRTAHNEATKAARAHEAAERSMTRGMNRKAKQATVKRGRGGKQTGVLGIAVGTAAGNLATGALRSGVRAIGNAFEESFDKAVKFESAMADVAKVVDGLKTPAGETTAAYAKLTDELKTLSTRIAVTPDGLAEMAAAAGQAGIKGGELTRFVEDAAKTLVAFDITADEAGNGLAKLRANLGLDQDAVMSLAGTMNVLSNNMASTAAEVLDATLRVGAVGKAANVSGQEVAGYTSAMIAAGATSEIAATSTKNMILALAAGTAATRRQREAFSKLGLNSEDVAKQFTGTAEQRLAITRKVITELGKLSNAQRASTTMQLFGRESLGPIASLTTNLETFDNAMKLATDRTAAATSVEKEYAVRSKTTANAVQLLKNQLSVTAIEIGEGMIPAIRDVMREIGEFLGASKEAGKGIGEVLGEGIKKAWHALKDFLGPADEFPAKLQRMVEVAAKFASGIIDIVGLFGTLIGKFADADVSITALGVGVLALLGPIGLVTAAALAMVAAFSGSGEAADEAKGMLDAGFGPGGAHDAGSYAANLEAYRSWKTSQAGGRVAGKIRDDSDAAYERNNGGMNSMVAGRSASQGVDWRDRRDLQHAAKKKTFVEMVRDDAAAKRARFDALQAKKRRGAQLRPSEAAEIKTLSKEFDEAVARKPGKGGTPKHKADSAYESDVEGEIERLSKEAGKRAGIVAADKKASRTDQYKAAAAAEAATKKQLRTRVDAGMSLPGNFMHDQLSRAGFTDVAGRGTPPPIAVTIIDVKPMNVAVNFTGPVTSNPREIRDSVVTVLREEIPRQLADGIRAVRMPIAY